MVLLGLDGLRPGDEAVVIYIGVSRALMGRLKDFGFVPGTLVKCCYRGPGEKVTALGFRGSVIAMRTRDLKDIMVRVHG